MYAVASRSARSAAKIVKKQEKKKKNKRIVNNKDGGSGSSNAISFDRQRSTTKSGSRSSSSSGLGGDNVVVDDDNDDVDSVTSSVTFESFTVQQPSDHREYGHNNNKGVFSFWNRKGRQERADVIAEESDVREGHREIPNDEETSEIEPFYYLEHDDIPVARGENARRNDIPFYYVENDDTPATEEENGGRRDYIPVAQDANGRLGYMELGETTSQPQSSGNVSRERRRSLPATRLRSRSNVAAAFTPAESHPIMIPEPSPSLNELYEKTTAYANQTISNIQEMIENQEEKEQDLEDKRQKRLQEAVGKFRSGNSRSAVRAMKKAMQITHEQTKIGAAIEAMEAHIVTIESTVNNARVVASIQAKAPSLANDCNGNTTSQHEEIQSRIDKLRDQCAVEIGRILTVPIDEALLADEALMSELEAIIHGSGTTTLYVTHTKFDDNVISESCASEQQTIGVTGAALKTQGETDASPPDLEQTETPWETKESISAPVVGEEGGVTAEDCVESELCDESHPQREAEDSSDLQTEAKDSSGSKSYGPLRSSKRVTVV